MTQIGEASLVRRAHNVWLVATGTGVGEAAGVGGKRASQRDRRQSTHWLCGPHVHAPRTTTLAKYFLHAPPRTPARAHPLQPSSSHPPPTIRTRRLRSYKSRVSSPSLTPPVHTIPLLPSLPLQQTRRQQHRRRRKGEPPFAASYRPVSLLPPLPLDLG
jgi:hypothetical protein